MTLRNLSGNATLRPFGLQVHLLPLPAPPLAQPLGSVDLQPGCTPANPCPGTVPLRVEGFIATRVEIKGASNYLENSMLQNMPRNQFLPRSPFIRLH